MNTLSQLSCSFMRKGLVRFVAPLLLSTLILLGAVGSRHAYAWDSVDLTVHADKSGQTNYVKLAYKGLDDQWTGTCQAVPALNWQDLHIQAELGNDMWLGWYPTSSCETNGDSFIMAVSLPVPSHTDSDCWFNPAAPSGTPNWSGCVNPSQTLTLTTKDGVNVS